jgi:hypothetical protein
VKNNNEEYKKLFVKVSEIIKKIDPENLEPGVKNGAPSNEYDSEIAQIVGYIVHNQETIKLNNQKLVDKINQIWEENFGSACRDDRVIVQEIIKIAF